VNHIEEVNTAHVSPDILKSILPTMPFVNIVSTDVSPVLVLPTNVLPVLETESTHQSVDVLMDIMMMILKILSVTLVITDVLLVKLSLTTVSTVKLTELMLQNVHVLLVYSN